MSKKEKDEMDLLVDSIMAKGASTSEDINYYCNEIKQRLYQAMLNGELNAHLGYESNDKCEKQTSNRRNGFSSKGKVIKTSSGEFMVDMPRDRNGTFTPLIITKRQKVLPDMDESIITLYAKGMTQRDIVEIIKQMYNCELSTQLISNIVKSVNKEVTKWQQRPLKSMYTFLYVDCLYVHVKEEFMSVKKPIYVIIGIDVTGHKEVVDCCIGDTTSEGAYFWEQIFDGLKERGVEEILFVSMDGLKGLNEAIERVYPNTITQRCVVHIVRNLYGKCNKKEAKEIISDFKKIYTAPNKEIANEEFNNFCKKHEQNQKIVKAVEDYMEYILPLFEVPKEIRKIIYTTNPIESVNSALRKVTRGKGSFPNNESVMKVLFLRIKDLEKKWTKSIPNWEIVLSQLIDLFGERITKYI